MKKVMMLMVAMLLVVGFTGQAMAAFNEGDLIRVVWSQTGGMESATSLGNIQSLTSAGGSNVIYNTDNFSLAAIGGTPADSYVSYFAYTTTGVSGANHAWIAGGLNVAGVTNARSAWAAYNGSMGAAGNLGAYRVNGGGAATVTQTLSTPNSFWVNMTNNGASVGAYKGFLENTNGAASLAALSTTGYVDQSIYYFASPSGVAGTHGASLNVATIRTYADGSTQLNPTPIPAAFLLFGSGLLGLVGIRRKNAA